MPNHLLFESVSDCLASFRLYAIVFTKNKNQTVCMSDFDLIFLLVTSVIKVTVHELHLF